MSIRVYRNGPAGLKEMDFTLGQFPAGEPLVQYEFLRSGLVAPFTVEVQGHSPLEFMQLCGILDIIKSAGGEVDLVIPYFPGGRQDRRDQTPLTVKVYADIINSYGCRSVTVYDPHSDVTSALIDNVCVVDQVQVLGDNIGRFDGVVAPDAGAAKKAFKVAQSAGLPMIQAGKYRDPATGDLSGFECPEVSEDGHWLIVDDLCDGGFTFTSLADKFKEVNPGSDLSLFVTHGIFSKGLDDLAPRFDHIITTNSFDQSDYSHLEFFQQILIYSQEPM